MLPTEIYWTPLRSLKKNLIIFLRPKVNIRIFIRCNIFLIKIKPLSNYLKVFSGAQENNNLTLMVHCRRRVGGSISNMYIPDILHIWNTYTWSTYMNLEYIVYVSGIWIPRIFIYLQYTYHDYLYTWNKLYMNRYTWNILYMNIFIYLEYIIHEYIYIPGI